jgi:hypothetical protein
MKLRAVHAVLAAVTLWPLVQLALVARFDVSPWKLGGWGMYSTPRFDALAMEVYGHHVGTARVEQLTAASPSVRDRAHAFLESYRWLRALALQAPLVDAVFSDYPEWDRVRLVLLRITMNSRTGMIEPVRAEYVHVRPVTDTSPESAPSR